VQHVVLLETYFEEEAFPLRPLPSDLLARTVQRRRRRQNHCHRLLLYYRLTGLPTFQKDTVAGCTFCAELNKVRGETIGLAILLHKSLREAELTPEQEGISVLEAAVKSAQVSTTIRFDIFAIPGSYADTHIQVR
jgi:hypothetical protein